jgi:Helitron helicase-like domain at N-terminus
MLYQGNQQIKGASALCKQPNGGTPSTESIGILSMAYDPMAFPLIFLLGKPGFHLRISKVGSNRDVTLREYYAYLLHHRDNCRSVVDHGRLSQQFFVVAYKKIEDNNLNYHKTHQSNYRVTQMHALKAAVERVQRISGISVTEQLSNIGTPMILPSSFTGSPRDLRSRTQDAISLIQIYGKPALFVTITMNANHPGLLQHLGYKLKITLNWL